MKALRNALRAFLYLNQEFRKKHVQLTDQDSLIKDIDILFLITTKVYSQNELTREILLEATLMVRNLPFILEVTDKLFMCERITDIKRLSGHDRQHELTIEVVTFEQAHSPPYNLIRVTLTDTPATS